MPFNGKTYCKMPHPIVVVVVDVVLIAAMVVVVVIVVVIVVVGVTTPAAGGGGCDPPPLRDFDDDAIPIVDGQYRLRPLPLGLTREECGGQIVRIFVP